MWMSCWELYFGKGDKIVSGIQYGYEVKGFVVCWLYVYYFLQGWEEIILDLSLKVWVGVLEVVESEIFIKF